ncbi:MAG: FliA/WhiG family RNA polymerase sigma factor [Nocardioides sp.]
MNTGDAVDAVDALWRRYKSSCDPGLRDRLIVHYSPLVKYVAGRVRANLPSSVEQDDLISDGVIGLMDAIEKFEVDRGLKFQTYAVPRVRGAMVDGLRRSDWVPRAVREKMREVNLTVAKLESRLHRKPTERELADELGITLPALGELYSQSSYANVSSIESDDFSDGTAPRSASGLPGADDGLPDGFASAVRRLPERDQVVVALYYWEQLSLAEIGLVLQVSESRVSQLLSRATQELRRSLVG